MTKPTPETKAVTGMAIDFPIERWWEQYQDERGTFSWRDWAREAKVTLEARDVPRETMELIWGGPLPEIEPADDFVPTRGLVGVFLVGAAIGAVGLYYATRRWLHRGR